ncbi:MAG: sigma-70 family RNA polymerase sigma factor [Planctomycetota bacterium]|nr:sigma-70 family RNA polymerase sigma factor [Planctomycetota bacterium]
MGGTGREWREEEGMPPAPPKESRQSDGARRRREAPLPVEAIPARERETDEPEEVDLATLPDEELMKLCQEADMEAFDVLYARYSGPVMSFIRRMIGDHSRSEVLTQEAFLRIFREAGNYRYPRSFSTWFYTIVRNLCKNDLRYMSRHPTISLEASVSESGRGSDDSPKIGDSLKARTSEPLDNILSEERERRLLNALNDLPELEREILILHRFQGLKYREISEIVGVPVGTVRSRLHMAIERLRRAVRDLL